MHGTERLAAAIERGDIAPFAALFEAEGEVAPPGDGFASSPPVLRCMQLALATTPLAFGSAVGLAKRVAEAIMIVSERALAAEPRSPHWSETLGKAAALLGEALMHEGDYRRVAALAHDVPGRIESLTDGFQVAEITSRGVDALVALGLEDEARGMLETARRHDDAGFARTGRRDINLPFAEARFAQAFSPITQQLDRGTVDTSAEFLKGIHAAYASITGLMGNDADLHRCNMLVQKAGVTLTDPATAHAPEALRATREDLREARRWYETNGHELDAMDALWPLAVICRRLGEHGEALAAMEEIRAVTDARRHGIADPILTAGLYGRYPYLHENMVSSALELGREKAALSVIEGSKGRAIMELRAARRPERFADHAASAARATEGTVERIDALVARLGIDYLSLFVGEDETIGVLVTASGTRHVGRIAMTRERLTRLMRQVDPALWRAFGATRLDRELAPLIDWALPHLGAGTLVISPDDPLHNLPFHYLAVDGKRLIDHVPVAKVHGVDDLRAIAENPADPPRAAHLVALPASDEGGDHAARRRRFDNLLADFPVPAREIPGASFDAGAARGLGIADGLLHLAAHGHVDGADIYRASGVLLASGGRLPSRGRPAPDGLLSPALVIESDRLDIAGATIAIQACVSGRSAEGSAGDALGLEWALMAKGARTVVASHWNVHYTPAIEFFRRFYAHWLGAGRRRVDAYRHAMLEIHGDPAFSDYDLDGFAFTLIGDWR